MDNQIKRYLKTPISYYGGKQSLLHHILPLIPDHKIYTETFFGGGAVFFAKVPAKNETINDKLDYVITFYKTLRTNFNTLKTMIDSTLISRTQHKQAAYILKHRKKYSDVEIAWAFWMRANFSFANKINGGLRFSNDQCTVVPNQLINHKLRFTEKLVNRLEKCYIENNDALTILNSRNVIDAFHYVDPPYFNADQGHYKGYTENDLIDLLDFLQNDCKGKFLLSNYNSEILTDYSIRNGWYKKEITQRIQASLKKDKFKTEVFIYNYSIMPKLFDND